MLCHSLALKILVPSLLLTSLNFLIRQTLCLLSADLSSSIYTI